MICYILLKNSILKLHSGVLIIVFPTFNGGHDTGFNDSVPTFLTGGRDRSFNTVSSPLTEGRDRGLDDSAPPVAAPWTGDRAAPGVTHTEPSACSHPHCAPPQHCAHHKEKEV